MATNSDTLRRIIETMAVRHGFDANTEITFLDSKGLLPKKMTAEKKPTPEPTEFASKQAAELAEKEGVKAGDIKIRTGGKGLKITVKDVQNHIKPASQKIDASPNAIKYALEHSIDIQAIKKGSGIDGKIKLEDVKAFEKQGVSTSDEDDEESSMPSMSPAATKLAVQYELDADDLAGIKGTGKNGKIKAEDLAELIKELDDDTDEKKSPEIEKPASSALFETSDTEDPDEEPTEVKKKGKGKK